jgi:hypothetical protein
MNYILNQKKELKFGNLSIIKKLKIKEFICSNIKILVLAQTPSQKWTLRPLRPIAQPPGQSQMHQENVTVLTQSKVKV